MVMSTHRNAHVTDTTPSPAIVVPCNLTDRSTIEVSIENADDEIKAGLVSWLKRLHPGHGKTRGQSTSLGIPETKSVFSNTSPPDAGVKIVVQIARCQRKRTSRYLCERDRREIIKRVKDGEQQATLAKEFNVSRAAICNLYKNRWKVLNRQVIDPKATHPRKKSRIRSASLTQTRGSTQPNVTTSSLTMSAILNEADDVNMPFAVAENGPSEGERLHRSGVQTEVSNIDQLQCHLQTSNSRMNEAAVATPTLFAVHEASAHSYPCRNLIAALRDEHISTSVFQHRATRLARLLVEDALACLPHEDVDVKNQCGDICRVTKAFDESNICGVSMERSGGLLLQAFSDISPASRVGIIPADSLVRRSSKSSLPLLPAISSGQVVLLLDIECATGDEASTVLQTLARQVALDKIYYVTLISSFEGLQKVHRNFPGVRLITAQMDTILDPQQRIRPGIGNFVQRFWNHNSSS